MARIRFNQHPATLNLILKIGIFLGVLANVSAVPGGFAEGVSREYQLKAAFLFRFLGFIRWSSELKSSEPRKICVLGKNPFDGVLERIIEQQGPGAEGITVSRHSSVADVSSCHLLYVGASEENRLKQILDTVRGLGVVTVSDIEDFAIQGGMIEMFVEGKNIRFTINRGEAQREGIDFSAQLLALSK